MVGFWENSCFSHSCFLNHSRSFALRSALWPNKYSLASIHTLRCPLTHMTPYVTGQPSTVALLDSAQMGINLESFIRLFWLLISCHQKWYVGKCFSLGWTINLLSIAFVFRCLYCISIAFTSKLILSFKKRTLRAMQKMSPAFLSQNCFSPDLMTSESHSDTDISLITSVCQICQNLPKMSAMCVRCHILIKIKRGTSVSCRDDSSIIGGFNDIRTFIRQNRTDCVN